MASRETLTALAFCPRLQAGSRFRHAACVWGREAQSLPVSVDYLQGYQHSGSL